MSVERAPPVLWGARTGNCLRAAIGLCEAQLSFSIRPVALRRGEHLSADFLSLNPAGKAPILTGIEANDPPLTLTQSNAILFYADQMRPGRMLPLDGLARVRAVERFFYFVTDVIGPNGAAFTLTLHGQGDAAGTLSTASLEAITRSARFLDHDPYMGGAEFSLADIAAFTIIKASAEHLPWDELPTVRTWFDRVEARPDVQRGWTMFDS